MPTGKFFRTKEHRENISKSLSGNRNHFWKGGLTKDKLGYILVYSPNHPFRTKSKYVLEHRLIMENIVGRYLNKDEDVHHINGIVDDNRPSNLQLLSHSDHVKIRPKNIRFCSKCNKRYSARGLCKHHYMKWWRSR